MTTDLDPDRLDDEAAAKRARDRAEWDDFLASMSPERRRRLEAKCRELAVEVP